MSKQQFTDNATTTLAAGISNSALALSVTAGSGSLFPVITGAQFFVATLVKNGVPTTYEIIRVTARTGDNFTVVRAQEGTTALAWNAGDTVTLLPTAGGMAGFVQFDDLQDQGGNYGVDTGTANAYVVNLSPAIAAPVIGMPIRFKAANSSLTANRNGSTLNVNGTGAFFLRKTDLSGLYANQVLAGGISVAVWDGTQYQLLNTPTIITGAFTCTCPDISGSPTTQMRFTQSGPLVTLYSSLTLNNDIGGTSTTSSLTLTGMASLQPSLIPLTNQTLSALLAGAVDASTGCYATVGINTAGLLAFERVTIGTNIAGSWTPSGNKNAPLSFVLTYSLI